MTISSDRIGERFAALRERRRRALVAYATAGYPDVSSSVGVLQALESAGADVIEVGVPFSDPIADGPIIQESSQRALANGATFDRTLDIVAKSRLSVPVVLFTYLNPLVAAGQTALDQAVDAGADGILVTDLPVGADAEREAWIGSGPLAFIRPVAPTTPGERMKQIAEHGRGFVYLISRLGVTGIREHLPQELPSTVRRLRNYCDLPICVGFGISRPDQAREVAAIADGVVVGSAIVRAAGEGVDEVTRVTQRLRAAIDECVIEGA